LENITMTNARYDVNSANTNRQVTFSVAADGGAIAETFLAMKGPSNSYPHYNQLAGVPTVEQELAQLRLSLVARALTAYAITVSLQVAADGSGFNWVAEQDEMGAFFNQALPPLGTAPGVDESWPLQGNAVDKHHVEDITDRLGTGGMTTIKTKPGLQSLVDSLATVSYDGGVTGPFANDTWPTTTTVTLPDGRVVTLGATAPGLVVGASASGLIVSFVSVG
jgi:hypothetical protein